LAWAWCLKKITETFRAQSKGVTLPLLKINNLRGIIRLTMNRACPPSGTSEISLLEK
jgi:hypothetical protein